MATKAAKTATKTATKTAKTATLGGSCHPPDEVMARAITAYEGGSEWARAPPDVAVLAVFVAVFGYYKL